MAASSAHSPKQAETVHVLVVVVDGDEQPWCWVTSVLDVAVARVEATPAAVDQAAAAGDRTHRAPFGAAPALANM